MHGEPSLRDKTPIERQGLFPCDAEVAHRLSVGEDKFRRLVGALELQGFPKRDPLMGRRYWPAVVEFWNRRYGVGSLSSPTLVSDGEENLSAF